MRAAAKIAGPLSLLLAIAACNQPAREAPANDEAAVTDIETLPPDESVATPTDELANGAAEPVDNDVAPQE